MKTKRGLGKNTLDVLLGSNKAEPISTTGHELRQIRTDQIGPGDCQPRRDMDPEALQNLANSIRAQGIIQPIVLRMKDTDRYEIIAGERRWRAAQLADLQEVPAIIRDIPDSAAVAIALIENIQREDLNPIEEALALQRLIEEFDLTHQDVADRVGRSRSGVTNLLRLLDLCDIVKTRLEHGDLEMGHARALLGLEEALQIQAAERVIASGLSVRETEILVRNLQQGNDTPKEGRSTLSPVLEQTQQALTQRLNTKITIKPMAKGQGKLIIHYKNDENLQEILDHIY